jgi:hypothetical protein
MYKVMRMELQESSREEESEGVQESASGPLGVQERGERGEEKSESELESRRRGGWYIVELSI